MLMENDLQLQGMSYHRAEQSDGCQQCSKQFSVWESPDYFFFQKQQPSVNIFITVN